MNDLSTHLIYRHTFDAQNLVDLHPPKLHNLNKQVIYNMACPPGCIHNGQLVVSRWDKMQLPQAFSASRQQPLLKHYKGYFAYESPTDKTYLEWYLNFAHYDLFCAYGGPLFAQDEMQVAEHPALGSLREALLDEGIPPLTVENGEPTPVLIRGVERRCAIATDRNPDQERPFGLYGNNFARATPEAIQLATRPIEPPTVSNIIAMEAPSYGYGSYTHQEIEYILATAFTGFSAARIETQLSSPQPLKVAVHTGFWGCGAYGGNRILMALLQLLAAHLAGVDSLIFHTSDPAGTEDLAIAQRILVQELIPAGLQVEIPALIAKIDAFGFEWGVSDGN